MDRSLEYLESRRWGLCDVPGCNEPADPHHLKAVGMGDDRREPSPRHYTADRLCKAHHTECEQISLEGFEKKYKVDLWWIALKSYVAWIVEKTPFRFSVWRHVLRMLLIGEGHGDFNK